MSTVPAKATHPRGLYLLFFTEMWERFGFYLMLGILMLYMLDNLSGGLGLNSAHANDIYGTYLALVYLTPFVGGLLADRIFGYRKTIVAGGALMAAGYFALAVPGITAFYVGLACIIVGNGLFKPNISTLLGNLYNQPEYRGLKDRGYNIFYMGINIGAFICNFIAAYMRNSFGWGAAFASAGVGMLIGLFIFMTGSRNLASADQLKPMTKEDMPLGKICATIFLPAIIFAIIGAFIGGLMEKGNIFGSTSNDAFLFACLPLTGFYLRTYLQASSEDRPRVGSLLYIFVVVIIFWAIFHQNGNVLTEWAQRNTWRPMPAALENIAEKTGMAETVTDLPGELEVSGDKESSAAIVLGNLTKENATSLAAKLGDPATVVEPEVPPLNETDAVFAVKHPVASAEAGKTLLADWLSKEVISESQLHYNSYLDTLPRESWPSFEAPAKLINTELFQSLNPFFVVILTPLVIGVFGALAKRKLEPSTPGKIALGLFITGLSTLVMIAAVHVSNNGEFKVSAMWLVCTYAVITIGELCLSPMGLSLVSKLSPGRLTAVMMGGWFLSTSIGNKLAGVLGHVGSDSDNKAVVFYINFAGATISALLLLAAVKPIRKILHEQEQSN